MVNFHDRPGLQVKKFRAMIEGEKQGRGKADLLVSLAVLFDKLKDEKEFTENYPEFPGLYTNFCCHLDQADPDVAEDDLTIIYSYLHGRDSGYTQDDRREFDKHGGYWCHAGGLSPLYRARPYITPETRLADYGAGNGLQGLLFQYLYPHQKTFQIELGRPMIEKGQRLQRWMGIPEERVEWLHKNVMDVPPDDFDFIYLYRPVRPQGRGAVFYERFAESLDRVRHRVTLFSVADCLKDFLTDRFRIFHDDGHLTCFSNEDVHGKGPGPALSQEPDQA